MIGAQLPKPVDNCDLLLLNDEWVMQEKFDGIRLTINKDEDGNVVCGDRNGVAKATPEPLKPLVEFLEADETFLPRNTMMDGEYLPKTEIFMLFDFVDFGHPERQLFERLVSTWDIARGLPVDQLPIDSVQTFYRRQKTPYFAECSLSGREGVVFKRGSSSYTPGKHSDWRKFKFVKDVDCVVIDKGVNGKDNIELGLYTPDGLKSVGKCSAVTGDGPRVKNGDVVTVTYLYVTKGRRLYQPVTPRLRTDKKPEECGFDQLKESA